jgi:hypothetical protein
MVINYTYYVGYMYRAGCNSKYADDSGSEHVNNYSSDWTQI